MVLMQRCRLPWAMVAWALVMVWCADAGVYGWSVKRDPLARRRIMRQRLQEMLRQQPFSTYALRQLLRLHKTQVSKAQLIQQYRSQMKHKRHGLAAQVVLGRLLKHVGDWEEAHKVFAAVLKRRPRWVQAQLSLLHCKLGLERHQEAMASLTSLLASKVVVGEARRRLLERFLRLSLKKGEAVIYRQLMAIIHKEPWFRSQRLWLARLLSKYGAFDLALPLFRASLKGLKGGMLVRLLLETTRAALVAKRGDVALAHLKRARAIKSLHKWYHWEMQMLEVRIFRIRKQLPKLVARLHQQWRRSRHAPSLVLLARLYQEMGDDRSAERQYLRVLTLYPELRVPRVQLLALYESWGEDKRRMYHLRQMVQHKVAMPHHYMALAKAALERSGIPSLPRWKPKYALPSSCKSFRQQRVNNRTLFYVFYRLRYWKRFVNKRQLNRTVCTREEWQRERRRRWREASAAVAPEARKAAVAKAIQWMRLSVKRFPRNWDSILEMERLLESHGLFRMLGPFHRALEAAVDIDLEQLSTMRDVLRQRGKPGSFMAFLKRLSRRPLRATRAFTLAEFMLAPEMVQSDAIDGEARLAELRGWEVNICPDLRRMIVPVLLRVAQQNPDQAWLYHRLALLAEHCGASGQWLRKRIRRGFAMSTLREADAVRLARFGILYRLTKPWQRLLRTPDGRSDARLVKLMLDAMPKDVVPSQIAFLTGLLQQARRPVATSRLLAFACRKSRELCEGAHLALNRLLASRHADPVAQVKALALASKYHLLEGSIQEWLPRLQKLFWDRPAGMNALAESSLLFGHSLAHQVQHIKLLHQALKLRTSSPMDLDRWRDLIWQKIYLLRYRRRNLKGKKYKDARAALEQLETAAMRFPHLYRSILARYYQRRYRYRARLRKLSRRWFQRTKDPIDLYNLHAWYPRRERKLKQTLMQSMIKRAQSPHVLYTLAHFAQVNGMTKIHILALEKLVSRRPKDAEVLKMFVDLLDRMPGPRHRRRADALATRWLALQPVSSFAQLHKQMRSCCVDRLAQLWMMRRVLATVGRLPWKQTRSLWNGLRKQLSAGLLRRALAAFAQLPVPKNANARSASIAQFAFALGVYGLVARALQPRWQRRAGATPSKGATSKPGSVPMSQMLLRIYATSLDLLGKVKAADAVWKVFFAHRDAPDREDFFSSMVRQGRQQHRRAMMIAGMFRLQLTRMAGRHVDQVERRDQIARLMQKGKSEQVLAQWLSLQGTKAGVCLRSLGRLSESIQPALAPLVWRLGFPYFGPLVAFAPCQWRLSATVIREQLKPLAEVLKQRKKLVIKLAGAASPDEPDGAFLVQQRVAAVRQALLQLGIPFHRVLASASPVKASCAPSLKPRQRRRCHAFYRQVLIVPINAKGSLAKMLTKQLTYAHASTQDADEDGVVDVEDACPLGDQGTINVRRRRRYGGAGASLHPYARLYPFYKWRRWKTKGSTTRQKLGCSSGRPLLRIKYYPKLQKVTLRDQVFYRRSYYVRRYIALYQLVRLRRLLPFIGRIRIEVLIREGRRYRRISPLRLAERRVKRLKQAIKRVGGEPKDFLWGTIPLDPSLPAGRQSLINVQLLDMEKRFPTSRKKSNATATFSPTLPPQKK